VYSKTHSHVQKHTNGHYLITHSKVTNCTGQAETVNDVVWTASANSPCFWCWCWRRRQVIFLRSSCGSAQPLYVEVCRHSVDIRQPIIALW